METGKGKSMEIWAIIEQHKHAIDFILILIAFLAIDKIFKVPIFEMPGRIISEFGELLERKPTLGSANAAGFLAILIVGLVIIGLIYLSHMEETAMSQAEEAAPDTQIYFFGIVLIL